MSENVQTRRNQHPWLQLKWPVVLGGQQSRRAHQKAPIPVSSGRHVNVKSFMQDGKAEILEKCKGIEDVLQTISNDGAHLWKVRSTSKWFRRRYMLNVGDMNLHYEPSYRNNSACFGRNVKRNIEIGDISDVRKGWKTDTFNKIGAVQDRKAKDSDSARLSVDEKACFSIVYNDGQRKDRTLDLVAPNPEIADKWVRAILHLVSWAESKKQEEGYELWLRRKFNAADVDNNKSLNFMETMKLIRELNIQMSDSQAKKLFDEANTRKAGKRELEVLDEDEFIAFYFRLLHRPEIDKLFTSYATMGGVLTAIQLCQFLQKEQGGMEAVSIDDCKELIGLYEQSDLKRKGQMTAAGFVNMLISADFDIFNKTHRRIYQDMEQPMSHYWIASSHNTYLLGNQLSSKSSVEAYVDALKRGCRCVEIDAWDGEDAEPIVWHGHTLTSKLLVKEVLEDAIKPYAFVTSSYPLILSLENHCSAPYQQKIAYYLRTILGDMLYTEEVSEDMENLPSPRSLKRKILLKAKKSKPKSTEATWYVSNENNTNGVVVRSESSVSNTKTTRTSTSTSSFQEVRKTLSVNVEMHHSTSSNGTNSNIRNVALSSTSTSTCNNGAPTVVKKVSTVGDTSSIIPIASVETLTDEVDDSTEESSSDEDEPDSGVNFIDRDNPNKPTKSPATEAIADLVNLVEAIKFRSFEHSKRYDKCYQMSSFAEAKAMKLIEKQGRQFVEYNSRQLSRIYPKGSRTGSSNFDPMQFWVAGCQIVALNYQTEDFANFLNYALFRDNGNIGYILKPEFLRNPSTQFDPNGVLDMNQGKILKLRIISGQHLPKAPGNPEIVDPYVEVKIVGLAQDAEKYTTKTVHNNGFNPVWDETFETRVRCPELAMLCIRVRDYAQSGSDMPLAHYAIPFNAIATGYRHIHLVTLKGVSLSPASLFVHIKLEPIKKP